MCQKPKWWDMAKGMHFLPIAEKPWLVRCKFDYHPRVVEFVREIPGADWEGKQTWGDKSPYQGSKIWILAAEMIPDVADYASRHGFQVMGKALATYTPPRAGITIDHPLLAGAKGPWQPRAVVKAVVDYAHLFNDETGLGKGWEVIKALQIMGMIRILVVCPAQVRLVWHNPYHKKGKGDPGEFDKWWPDHPRATTLEPGKNWGFEGRITTPTMGPNIIVVSYEMLPRLLQMLDGSEGIDAIVFDEIHYLQSATSLRSMAAVELVKRFPTAYRAGMTATAITNHPSTVAHPLNILFPGRYVTGYKFARRHCNEEVNEGGFSEFTGLREENAAELRRRLNAVSSRATKKDPDVKPFLPRFSMQPLLFIDPAKRIPEVIEWIGNKVDEDPEHVCLLTHFRVSAEQLALELSQWRRFKDYLVVCIHGEDQQKDRIAKIRQAREAKKSVICATLHSVNVGIDMAFHDVIAFVELSARPSDDIQAMGRFNRLSGDVNCDGYIFASKNLDDGAEQLAEKMDAIGKVIPHGLSEGEMSKSFEALKGKALTDDEFTDLMGSIAEGYNPELAGSTDDVPF